MTKITAPKFPRLVVTYDEFGSGVNDEGTKYAAFLISRPATATRGETPLAEVTLYADDAISPLVWDRYSGDSRPGDLKAIQQVRDVLKRDYPTAQANSYRFTAV